MFIERWARRQRVQPVLHTWLYCGTHKSGVTHYSGTSTRLQGFTTKIHLSCHEESYSWKQSWRGTLHTRFGLARCSGLRQSDANFYNANSLWKGPSLTLRYLRPGSQRKTFLARTNNNNNNKKKKRKKAFLDNATHCLNFARRIGNQWGWILLLTTATMEVFKEPILQWTETTTETNNNNERFQSTYSAQKTKKQQQKQ